MTNFLYKIFKIFFKIRSPYLCRFYVHPNYRGRNIYPLTIIHLLKSIVEEKKHEAFLAVEHTNKSSLKGIEKLGFQFLKEFKFIRICGITLNKHLIK